MLGKSDALRAQSGGVSDCDMGIGVSYAQLPNLPESLTMHQVEHARICDRVDSHTETPQLLPARNPPIGCRSNMTEL